MKLKDYNRVKVLVERLEWLKQEHNLKVSIVVPEYQYLHPEIQRPVNTARNFIAEVIEPVVAAKKREIERSILDELKSLGVDPEDVRP
jgi:hypothetical protein